MLIFLVIGTIVVGAGLFSPPDASDQKDGVKKYKIAMISDSGGIDDKSFNQNTFEACRNYGTKYGLSYTYFKADNSSEYALISMVDLAVARGYNIIVMPGFSFAKIIKDVSFKYPEIKFVLLDVNEALICAAAVGSKYYENPSAYDPAKYYNKKNTYCAIYQEELSGYMAGYMATKSGYRQMGFLGGEALPSVIRYGSGFLQGIDAAAEELGIADEVSVRYAYAGQFVNSTEITAVMDTWYSNGTEVVFSAGGLIYASVADAAVKSNGKMIGVDNDQTPLLEAYAKGIVVTSAMKGIKRTVYDVLDAIIYKGTWEKDYVGRMATLGIVSGTDSDKNYVGLPEGGTQWSERFTREDYRRLVKDMADGVKKVDPRFDKLPETKVKVQVREGTIM